MKYVIEMGEKMSKEPDLTVFSKFAEKDLKNAEGIMFFAWKEDEFAVFCHGKVVLADVLFWVLMQRKKK